MSPYLPHFLITNPFIRGSFRTTRMWLSAILGRIENVFPHFPPTFAPHLSRERALACILTIYSRDSRESFPPWILIMVSFCSERKEEAGPPVKDFLSPSRSSSLSLVSPFLFHSHRVRLFHLHPSLPRIYVTDKSRRIFSAILEVPTW